MKKLTLHYFILLFICISCDQTEIHPVLMQAEDLMGTKPDSSLLLLERIEYPEKMSKPDYATWCLLITRARDKNYVEHTSDSIITVAVNYFEEKNIPSRKAWSYFYLGRIQSDLGETDKAIDSYLKANTYVENLTDNGLKGRICENAGLLYWNHLTYNKAKTMYEQAHTYYKADKDTIGILYILMKLGNIQEALNKPDDAISIYTEAQKIAEAINETEIKASLLKSIGNSYTTKKQHTISLSYFRQSLLYPHNEESKHSLYYSIASAWTDLFQPDSAFHYLHEAMKSDNLYIKCSGNRLLYKLYGQKGELKKSHEANEEYLHLRDSIEISNRPAEIAKMEALYQKEKSENEKQTIILKSKEKQFTYLLILLISYIIGSLIANKYHSRLKAQQHKLQKNKHVLIEKEKQLQTNKHIIEKQDLLLTSLQNQIEEKARQLETEKLYLKQMQEENNETVSQLLWKQENTNRELNALRDEKYRILNMQEETYRERSLLLKGKKQLETDKTQLLSKNKELEAEIANMMSLQKASCQEKEQLIGDKEITRKSIIEQSKTIERVLKSVEEWKKELISQNKFLIHLQQSEPFSFTKQDWVEFEENFSKVFPFFILNLKKEFPSMTDQYCDKVRLKNGYAIIKQKVMYIFSQRKYTKTVR